MRTIKAIIEKALREITALAEAEQPTAHMIQDGLVSLNDMLALWSIDGLKIPYASRVSLLGDNTKASYTWGVGGDINTVAPVNVAAVSFRLANLLHPLEPVENTVYMQSRWLANVGQPRWFYYERQHPLSFLHFDCAPFGGSFDIWASYPITPATSLTEEFALPDYYATAVISNLAIALTPDYGKAVTPELGQKAFEAKRIVEKFNAAPPPDLSLDGFPTARRYNNLPMRTS